jgi:hypothetical protein
MRLVLPIIIRAQGSIENWFFIKTRKDDQVVSYGGYSYPRSRKKGLNQIWLRLDPAHGDLAPTLIQYFTHHVMTESPGLRVEFDVPIYMEAVVVAAESAGFERRVTYNRMGMIL